MNDLKSLRPVKLVLASASVRRVELLERIGAAPDVLLPTDLDEAPLRNEAPRSLAQRLAKEKVLAGAALAQSQDGLREAVVIAADTVVAVGRRILPKCELMQEAGNCLRLLSGRQHHVYTGVAVVGRSKTVRSRLVDTKVRFKRLSGDEIDAYLACGEWRGKAGGYAIQGYAGAFVVRLVGSWSSVVGLPLYETANLLESEGFSLRQSWMNASAL